MHLAYFTTHVPNFGDDLNADIWPALAPGLFADDDPGHSFVGIGTILGLPRVTSPRIEVFSTGAGNDPIANWAGRRITYHCVRGPVTARLCGIDADRVVTDGGLLVPQVPGFPDRAAGGGGTVVIPHFETAAHGDWQAACALAGMRYLDPRRPTREVVGEIAGADRVLTESLHGAIIADSYGVPWQAFACSRNFGTTKWVDWLASLDLRFTATLVPPPDAAYLLRVGLRAEPWGTAVEFSLEDALQEFTARVEADRPRPLRRMARELMLRLPPLQHFLGYSAARTASALTELAQREPVMSAETVRQSRTDQLLSRLRALESTTLA